MTPLLFDPDRHTALTDRAWDEAAARTAIEAIVKDARVSMTPQGLWPLHPDDTEPGETEPHCQLYFGAAGVVLGLSELARRGFCESAAADQKCLPFLLDRNRRTLSSKPWRDLLGAGWQTRSWLMGDAGILFVQWRLTGERQVLDALEKVLTINNADPSNEMMWGAPGTLLASLLLQNETREARWSRIFAAGAAALEQSLQRPSLSEPESWTQHLYGQKCRYLGLGHGFAGAALPLLKGGRLLGAARHRDIVARCAATLRATAMAAGEGVNWPTTLPAEGKPPKMLLQQCHGAPGIITTWSGVSHDLDDLLLGAGRLIWTAGALKKGAGFCHGSAGNGFALLKLFAHTADELWLARARQFAMHALAQAEDRRMRLGQGRYSLWTGDIGVALFVAACCQGLAQFPSLDDDDFKACAANSA